MLSKNLKDKLDILYTCVSAFMVLLTLTAVIVNHNWPSFTAECVSLVGLSYFLLVMLAGVGFLAKGHIEQEARKEKTGVCMNGRTWKPIKA